jgi:hypothetical protein
MLGVDRVTGRHVVLVIWSQWTGSVGSCVVRLTFAGRPRNTSSAVRHFVPCRTLKTPPFPSPEDTRKAGVEGSIPPSALQAAPNPSPNAVDLQLGLRYGWS